MDVNLVQIDLSPAAVFRMRTLCDPNRTPRELWQYRQFVCWRYVDRGPDRKADKLPVNPKNLANAGSTWRNTWTDIRTAVAAYQRHSDLAGIGFVLTDHDPYTMIDLDNCVGNSLSSLAAEVVGRLDTYTEYSPSGRGLRLFVRCEQPATLKCPEIEIYNAERFATLTGNVLRAGPIATVDSLDWLVNRFRTETATTRPTTFSPVHQPAPADDIDLWRRICSVNPLAQALFNGDVAQARGDHSRAVILLLNSLARWTAGDAGRMRRMIEQTSLDRAKWYDKRGNQDWLTGRIQDAISYMGGR